jgi:hypothetical protein
MGGAYPYMDLNAKYKNLLRLQVAISRALASFWRYPYLDQS